MTDIIQTDTELLGAIARIESRETSTDEIAETLDKIDFAMERAKELRKHADESLTARIKATGPVECGKWLYVLKHPKTTKCTNVSGAIEECLQTVGGDFNQFCQLLAAQPLKHGACREVLSPDAFGRLFVTEIKDEVEKKLAKLDTNFINQK